MHALPAETCLTFDTAEEAADLRLAARGGPSFLQTGGPAASVELCPQSELNSEQGEDFPQSHFSLFFFFWLARGSVARETLQVESTVWTSRVAVDSSSSNPTEQAAPAVLITHSGPANSVSVSLHFFSFDLS